MSDFLHLKVGDNLWLSACKSCRQVVAFAPAVEEMHEAEEGHKCPASHIDPPTPAEAA